MLVVGGGVAIEGDPVEGDPVLEPAEDPSGVGELLGVPMPLASVVPCIVVLEPLEPVSFGPFVLPLPVVEPMLPGCVDCVPLCVPVLPAAPVPAPLPVWAKARVPSESVAIKRSLRIVLAFSCTFLCPSIQPVKTRLVARQQL